ncbi:MAG: HlyD family efflux transporter periplasmic adaptor subunit [Spirochaetaceae bacterium]|nr:HlyD family efflux transporter periplasmic adaptor subunit [Spirochaetaceae bacterium]
MSTKKIKNKIIAAVLCVVLAAVILFAVTRNKKQEEIFYTVHSEEYRNVIEIAGNISAAKEQKLQAAGDGTVMAVYVKEGDSVKKDQLLLQIDDTEQRYNLAKHDYEMDQRRITGAPRELALMRTQRLVMLQRIKDRQISASFDGVVAQFSASAGDYLEAKDSVGIILDRTYLTATVEIVETDAPKLAAGQKAVLYFPANKNIPIEAYVYSFPAVATKTSRGAAVVNAEIRIDNPPDLILPNYSFTGEIEISPAQMLTLVERAAVERDDKKAWVEKVNADGTSERVEIEVKPYGGFMQVLKGLSAGDVVKQLVKDPVSGRNATVRQGQSQQTTRQNQNAMPFGQPAVPRR